MTETEKKTRLFLGLPFIVCSLAYLLNAKQLIESITGHGFNSVFIVSVVLVIIPGLFFESENTDKKSEDKED